MTTIRRISVSQIEGNDANVNDADEIRPFGETAFYLDTDRNPSALALMMFDGLRTHRRSKILRPGMFYGSNGDSSDGLGYDTIKLIPDSVLDFDSEYTNDQYIIIEPTAGEPPHVHIRSGGTIDNSTADLLLGGELNHVRVSDANNRVVISTDAGEGGTEFWNFGGDGKLTLPTGGVIGPYGMGWTGITNGTAGTPISIAYLSNVDGSELSSVNLSSNNGEAGQVSIFARTANTTKEWIFDEYGATTFPDDTIKSANNLSITVGLHPLVANVAVHTVDIEGQNQRMFISDTLYPNLDEDVTIGAAATTSWGTPVTATVQDVTNDAGYWILIFNQDQDLITGLTPGDIVTFGPGNRTWEFGSDGVLTIPGIGTYTIAESEPGMVFTSSVGFGLVSNVDGISSPAWIFGADGTTSFPSGLILAPAGQNITMQSDQYSQLTYQNADVSETPNIAISTNFFVAQNSATLDIVYRDGGSNQQTKSWLWNIEGLTFPDNTVQTTAWGGGSVVLAPNTSIGDSTDVEGRIAFDSTYFYYCTANYNGSDNIWKRVAWSMDTW